MMDLNWTEIIIAIIGFIGCGGGLIGVATISEKKTEAALKNVADMIGAMTKIADNWQEVNEERKNQNEELMTKLNAKDEKIDKLFKELERKREKEAVLLHRYISEKILRCDDLSCPNRKPPISKSEINNVIEGAE